MKKLIITLLCLAIVAAGGKFGYQKYKQSKDDKRIVDVVPVSMISEDMGWMAMENSERYDARVVSSNTQTVGLGAEDQIKEVKVKVGDYVKKGDVLLELDTTRLELVTAQQKAEIGVIEVNIKKGKRELERLKTLLPSEMKPAEVIYEEPEEPDFEEEFSFPDSSSEESSSFESSVPDDEPEMKLIDKLGTYRQASGQDEDGVFQFNMTFDAIVAKPFMSETIQGRRKAVLNVYSDEGVLLYMWVLDGTDEKLTVHDWTVNNGVTLFNNMVSYDGSGEGTCGAFYVYTGPQPGDELPDDESYPDDESIPDDAHDFDHSEFDDFDYADDGDDYYYEEPEPDENRNDNTPVNENYMYPRAELDKKIREQENAIKDLELDLREKKLAFENSQKKVNDGRIVAKIDGIVAKVGKDKLGGSEEEEYYEDEEYYEEEEMYGDRSDENLDEEPDSDLGIDDSLLDSSYIIIRGDEATNVEIEVGELSLPKFTEGAKFQGMNYQTGESFTISVTGVKDEPASYSNYNWSDNPNSSTFVVTGRVEEENSLVVDSWIDVTPLVDYEKMAEEQEKSTSLFVPMWYLHREGSGYYVMKADEKGLLKKQYVKTGIELYGELVEVKAGLSTKDKICFPYGKDVKEGVRTHESDEPVSIYDDY